MHSFRCSARGLEVQSVVADVSWVCAALAWPLYGFCVLRAPFVRVWVDVGEPFLVGGDRRAL